MKSNLKNKYSHFVVCRGNSYKDWIFRRIVVAYNWEHAARIYLEECGFHFLNLVNFKKTKRLRNNFYFTGSIDSYFRTFRFKMRKY